MFYIVLEDGIRRTDEKNFFRTLVPVHPVYQRLPAVPAEQQPGEQIDFLGLGRPMSGGSTLLGKCKGFLVNQRFVSVWKEIPLALRVFPRLFALIGHFVGFRRDGMAQIFLPGENIIQRLFRPVVPSVQLRTWMLCFSCPAVAKFANGQNLVIPQPILDFTDTAATHIHGKNLFHHISRFRVGDKVIAVVRVGQIAIWHFPIDALSPLGFGLLDSPDFLRCVTGVKLIEPIEG